MALALAPEPTNRPAPTAAVYCRISKDSERQGLGVARQEHDGRALAELRGWVVVEVYVDNDISAARVDGQTKARPEYQRMLAAVTAGQVDAVVVWDQDRLVRDPMELEEFFIRCERAGMHRVASVGGDIDISTGEGVFVARIKAATAAEEVRKTTARVRRKHLELAEAGKLSGGGGRSFGYDFVRDDRGRLITLAVVPAEAELIREAARRALAGESIYSISADWNRRGLTTPTGRSWYLSGLRTVLISARISGRREHNGKVYPAVWDPIITPAESDRLRKLLTDPARRTSKGGERRYLLTGLLRCGREGCGAKLVGRPREGVPRYICPTNESTGKPGCGGTYTVAEPVDRDTVERLLKAIESGRVADALAQRRAERGGDETATLAAQVEADRAKLIELGEDYDNDLISRPEWLQRREKVAARLEAAERTLERQHEGSSFDGLLGVEDVRAAWDALPLDRKRAVLAEAFETITVAPVKVRGGNRFDPDRLSRKWRI